MVDETKLTELSTVVALTKWASEGCAAPFFIWALRDFALDMKEYRSSDDYLERILNPSEFQANTEKHRMRKAIVEYFPARSCICFVRPLDSESAIRSIDRHKLSELRPQFQHTVEQFKKTVASHLTPKRFDQKILNGPGFAKLIKEILDNFNNAKVPTVRSAVERLMEAEKNESVAKLNALTNAKFTELFGKDPLFHETILKALWAEHLETLSKKKEKSGGPDVFALALDHLYDKVDREAGGTPQFLKSLDLAAEKPLSEGESGLPRIKQLLSEVAGGALPGRWALDRLLGRGLRSASALATAQATETKAQLEEKRKELSAEKDSTAILSRKAREEMSFADDFRKKITEFQGILNAKNAELETLNSSESEEALRRKVENLRDEVENLEHEKGDMMGRDEKSVNILRNSVFKDFSEGYTPSFEGKKVDELKEFFDFVSEAYLRENQELKNEFEQLSKDNFILKAGELDNSNYSQIISDLQKKLRALQQSRQDSADLGSQIEFLQRDTRRLEDEKRAMISSVVQLIVSVKKKKPGAKEAFQKMNPKDKEMFESILAESKVSYS